MVEKRQTSPAKRTDEFIDFQICLNEKITQICRFCFEGQMKEMADTMGINRNTLYLIANPNSDRSVTLKTLLQLANAVPKLNFNWLIKDTGSILTVESESDTNSRNAENLRVGGQSSATSELIAQLGLKDAQLAEKDAQIAKLHDILSRVVSSMNKR